MAIQLNTQTAQQKQAPFSAFDTTSSYRSGLSGVAQGLSTVASAASRMHALKTRQKEQAQNLLAGEAFSAYEVELDRVSNELDAAYKAGNTAVIEAKKAEFAALEAPEFNNYLGEDAGGTIDSPEAIAPYQQRGSVAWGRMNNSFELKEQSSLISRKSSDYLSESRALVTKAITGNPAGLDQEGYTTALASLDPTSVAFQNLVKAQPNDQTRDAFKRDAASNALGVIKHQLKTATSVETLNERKEQGDEFLTASGSEYEVTSEQALQLEDLYSRTYKAVSEPEHLVAQAEKEYTAFESSYDNFWSLTKATDSVDAAVKLEQMVILAKDNPLITKKYKEELAEAEEVLSMFLPTVDANGDPISDSSTVDLLARQFIRKKPDQRPSFADFRQLVDENKSLSDSAVNKIQKHINDRIAIAERGVAEGDLTSLGALYPELEGAVASGDKDKARLIYQDSILPELKGGDFRLPPQMWFGTGDTAYPVRDVATSTSVVLELVANNTDFEGAAITGMMGAMGNPKTSSDMFSTYQTASVALRAVKQGDDPQEVITSLLTFAELAEANKNNPEVEDIYNNLILEEDKGLTVGVDILDTVQKIKQLELTTRTSEASFYKTQLRGQIASGLKLGKSEDEIRNDIQNHEDRYLRPYAGSLRQVREGQVAYIHPDVYNENVAPEYERVGLLGSFFNPIKELPVFGGKTGAKRVADYTQSAVIAYAVKNYELSDIGMVQGDMDYGFRSLKTKEQAEPTPVIVRGRVIEVAPSEQKKLTTDQTQEALFLGFNNNNYYSEVGMLGPKGEGVPIVQVRGTTFRTEADQYDRAVEKEYYVIEAYNARTQQYEPLADNSGNDVLVPVDAVNPKVRSAVLEDVNLNPFDMTTGDVFGSTTAVQSRMWRLFN